MSRRRRRSDPDTGERRDRGGQQTSAPSAVSPVGVLTPASEPRLRNPLPHHRLQREAADVIAALAFASLAVTAVTVLAAFTALRWQARAHDRQTQAWTQERRELVEAVAHLADRPLPERGWDRTASSLQPIESPLRRQIADPEQLPKF